MAGMSEKEAGYTQMPDGAEMQILQKLGEDLKRDDADLRAILAQVVEVLIRKETGERFYDPFAGQTFFPVEGT